MTATVVTGKKEWSQSPDDVVGGETRIRVRCDVDRFDTCRERDDGPLGDDDELREPAVPGEPGEGVLRAVHVVPATAGDAEPATIGRIDDHGVAGGDGRDTVTDGLHPARALVSQNTRQRDTGRLHETVDRMEVGCADPGAADPDEHVSRPFRLRRGPLDQLERLVVLAQEGSPHASALTRRGRGNRSRRGRDARRAGPRPP